MKIIRPTKKEVFKQLKQDGCVWLGGNGCECKSRQISACYTTMEKFLTKYKRTPKEIKQCIEENKKFQSELEKALAILHGEID